MASPVNQIEAAYKRILTAATRSNGTKCFKRVFEWEPPDVGSLPAATLLFSFISQHDGATGGITENGWQHIVNLYMRGGSAKLMHEDLRECIPAVLDGLREDRTLGGLVYDVRIEDGGPPQFDAENGYMVKALLLTAVTEEV